MDTEIVTTEPEGTKIPPEPERTPARRPPTFAGLQINGFDDLHKFATMVKRAGLAPPEDTTETIMAKCQYAAELNIGPMQALSGLMVNKGKASAYGDLFIALCQSHPAYEWHKEWVEGEGDDQTWHCEMKRKGGPPHHRSFSVGEAKAAGLWNSKDVWRKFPGRMMEAKPRSWAGRAAFADRLKGLIDYDEAEDFPPPKFPQARVVDAPPADAGFLAPPKPRMAESVKGTQAEGVERAERIALLARYKTALSTLPGAGDVSMYDALEDAEKAEIKTLPIDELRKSVEAAELEVTKFQSYLLTQEKEPGDKPPF